MEVGKGGGREMVKKTNSLDSLVAFIAETDKTGLRDGEMYDGQILNVG